MVDNLEFSTGSFRSSAAFELLACLGVFLKTSQRVISKDDITTQQCNLANVAFESTGCCSSPNSLLCNKPLPIFNIAPLWIRYSFNSIYINDYIEFVTLQTELDNQRAVEIGFKWTGGGGHAFLAVGWDIIDSVPQVIIYDLWRGEIIIPYDKVKTVYGEGQWRWTWINIRR